MIEIKTPVFPESIADGEVAAWHVEVGETVKRDQVLVDIETDKVVLEVVSPENGTMKKIIKQVGETVLAEETLGEFEPSDIVQASQSSEGSPEPTIEGPAVSKEILISPAARKLAEENKIKVDDINGTGKGGRITKEDILRLVAAIEQEDGLVDIPPSFSRPMVLPITDLVPEERVERRVPMTRLRASIAQRLVEAQHNAAMLTTFNEVDMRSIMDLRTQYREAFEKAHNGTRLGFMSFFVRASVEALKRFPSVNASIDDNDIVYHGYQDIGVAVSSPRGLVVPVIREADSLTLAEIEDQVRDFGTKAQEGKLSIDEMTGGTFTISNGGVFGSLMSTPILNPPQTGILGMHKIQERPVVVNGQVEIRPMMYLALSYDHRLIDGSEAVRFLVTIKDFLEEPARILLDI
ncbi:MAG: dihydrolipoyllysine-residue succinyltransferase [Gammaproteobacteria bacterium]|uniref:Dihydrolipoyllysine-residue succinyltransferase component of 2-oxoglutarate dehydrogenase complex n=1 Tax=OM182 bacterium TaxID=2510334 RepID=A0A520S0V4_9GAMM|nr:dihydrolipoyllysine-residue succinyltransferase [Gammaproteobacteria bacterium]OUV67319.1 MAG: dihydrolipoamide succinyltransferase [Gammaproteobacteria bacterium TMED133]RZO76085.1 MAG: 2-oxoglutarate dehydrogenase complex dihydrolipoyllysine-residue succinyltransferase [OM182 bacterium]